MNKNLKKLLAVVLVLVIAAGSVAASAGAQGGEAPEPSPSAPAEPAPDESSPSAPAEPAPAEHAASPVWQVLFGLRNTEVFEAKLSVLLPGEKIPAEDIEALKAIEDANEFYTAFRALLIKLSGGSVAAMDSILLLSVDADFAAAFGNIMPEVPREGKDGGNKSLNLNAAAAVVEKLLAAESMAAFDEIQAGLSAAELEAFSAYLSEQPEKAEALENKIDILKKDANRVPFNPVTVPYLVAGPLMDAVQVQSSAPARRAARYSAGPAFFSNESEEDDGIELYKSVTDRGDGSYTLRLESYITGKVTTETKSNPVDVVLLLDQSGSMGDNFSSDVPEEKQAAMKTAVTNFITELAADSSGADHRLAIVAFSDSAALKTKGGFVDVKANEEALKKIVNDLSNRGTTNVGEAMGEASRLLLKDYSYSGSNTQRQKVVILFTDGIPSKGMNRFSLDYANKAIAHSKDLKAGGCTVYSVGIMEGSAPDMLYGVSGITATSTTAQSWAENVGVWEDYTLEGNHTGLKNTYPENPTDGKTFEFTYWTRPYNNVREYKQLLIYMGGTWYVAAESDFETGGGKPGTEGYWWKGDSKSDEDIPAGNRFMNYVSSNYPAAANLGLDEDGSKWTIRTNYSGSNAGYYLTASSSAELNSIFESISEHISTPTIDLGTETIVRDTVTEHFSVPEDVSAVRLYTSDYLGGGNWKKPAVAEGLTPVFDGNTLSVTGFDYAENFMSETPKPDGTRGSKLIVEFEIKPIPGFIGGNNILTNGADSGIYKDNEAETPLDTFPLPDVDVVIPEFTLNNESDNIYLGNAADLDSFVKDKNEKLKPGSHRNDFVTITYTLSRTLEDGTDRLIASYTIPAGAASGTWSYPEGMGAPRPDNDISYKMRCSVVPTSEGTYPGGSAEATADVKVFKPEYSFRDSEIFLGTTVPDYNNDNIASGPLWKHGETSADVNTMGEAPELNLEFNPPAAGFKTDTDVTVTVRLDQRDITEFTNKIPAPINEDEDYHDFTVKVISGTIIINKETAGAAEDERFIFKITAEGENGKSYMVGVPANGSVKVSGLPQGRYIVTEDSSWSWDYGTEVTVSTDKPLGMDNRVITYSVTNTPKGSNILNDSTSVVNNSVRANEAK